jgi:membrane protein required for colicin V production
MPEMIWTDYLLLGIVALSSLMSLMRGFAKEAMSLVIWVVAFIVARHFGPNMQTLLQESVDDPRLLMLVAFVILFVGTLLVGAVISFLVTALIKVTGLSPLDRLLGIVFGAARGVIICVAIIAVLRLTHFAQAPWWQNSLVIEHLSAIELWSRSVLESDFDIRLP